MFDLIYRFDPRQGGVRQAPADAEEARRRLAEGNQAYSSILSKPSGSLVIACDPQDIGVAVEGGAPRQQPFAVVVGCSDARVPIELIFDRACNELFVVRVAGNILGQEGLGSIDYAVENLGASLRLIVVLGHTHCGAVTAAADAFLRPAEYLSVAPSHTLRAVVNNLFPAVQAAAVSLSGVCGDGVKKAPGYRETLIETAIVFNAALTAAMLHQEFGGERGKGRRTVFGVFDLATRQVGAPLDAASPERTPGLVEPPIGPEACRAFAAQVVRSGYIQRVLKAGERPAS
jgi:carbonic anhydrase